MAKTKAPTHTAYAMKRESRRHGRWLEIGTARRESTVVLDLFLDRTPIGGFNGYVYLAPIGGEPPHPKPERLPSIPKRKTLSPAVSGTV